MKKFNLTLIAFALSSCATQYQQSGISGGFTETQLDENVWKVVFSGNGYTSQEKTENFTLLRGADLALKHGYDYFAVQSTRLKTDYDSGGSAFTKTFIMYKEKPTNIDLVLNAKFVCNSIGAKYQIKCESINSR